MMHGSTGGEHNDLSDVVASFEGLVLTTARMFASQVGYEEDDLAQELRMKVWHAVRRYDPTRSKLPMKRYVFGAMTNRIKDFKRGAAREVKRRETNGLAFLHIEDTRTLDGTPAERFDQLYYHTTHDEVYGGVEAEPFAMPAGVTDTESKVAALLVVGCDRQEIALLLGLAPAEIKLCLTELRAKLADWRPGPGASGNVRELPTHVGRYLAAA